MTDSPHSLHHTNNIVCGVRKSRLPEFEQTIFGVSADEVLMWMMNNANHIFLVNLVKEQSVQNKH